MAHHYLPVNREQQFLLPPDMADWLGNDHLVWFVIEAVSVIDTSVLHERQVKNNAGRASYDPDMLLTVLLYSYCMSERSSRQIERLCEVDVAYRVACGDNKPDHTTIARFRQSHARVAEKLFCEVLRLAAVAGVISVGVVALDGTKMKANASKKANKSTSKIEEEVAKWFAEAEEIDAEEDRLYGDARGDELPPELADPKTRKERLIAAKEAIERRAKEEDSRKPEVGLVDAREREQKNLDKVKAQELHNQKMNQARWDGNSRSRAALEGDSGRLKRAKENLARAVEKRQMWEDRVKESKGTSMVANVTDPDSRLLKTADGFVQGYNAQAIVDENGVIVAADIWDNPADVGAYQPLVEQAVSNCKEIGVKDPIGTVVADAGYHGKNNLEARGPDRIIATGKSHRIRKQEIDDNTLPVADRVEENQRRLRTTEGRATYSLRQHMIEPVFGDEKHNRGFRQFVRRGTNAAKAEWQLMMTAHNLRRLFALDIKL